MRAVSVALPLPVRSAFTYAVPDGLPWPEPGTRVLVPFGARKAIGLVTGPATEARPRELKDVLEVLDEAPLLPPPLLGLAAWVSEHYLAPPGECLRLALPPGGVRGSRAVVRAAASPRPAQAGSILDELGGRSVPVSVLARRLGRDPGAELRRLRRAGAVVVEQHLASARARRRLLAALIDPRVIPRGPAQSAVRERLLAAGAPLDVAGLARGRPSWRSALTRLAARGAVRLYEAESRPGLDVLPGVVAAPAEPTEDQGRVLAEMLQAAASRGFAAFLLHGVTGSGKTEVYLRLVEHTLAAGRSALLLVPEIALTPLLVRAAVARFGRTVAVMHSDLTVVERREQWWRVRDGEARLVVGARSAVFAPLVAPGLIVVDEEHEAAYKQEESPRYQARDVAVMRARLEGALVVLGSATPSLESSHNARTGKYRQLRLPLRIGGHGLPRVEVVDRREARRGGDEEILSATLRQALGERLARGEQALLLLNRRGFAVSLLCRECGAEAVCPNCSVSLVIHAQGRLARCHYCGHEAASPGVCPTCRGEYLKLRGYGTEKVMEAVAGVLPEARVERLDRDTSARRGHVGRVLAGFERGEIDVLVGTQMIAKGHDFPRVTLVGVVDADVGLGLPDFRAAERTFQLLTQVAGRAGRADLPGEVVLQSYRPDHYALRLACAQDYGGFLERELEFRRTMGYPPAGALVNLVFRAAERERAAREAWAVARALRERSPGLFRVLGPASAPLARLRGEFRMQVLLKGPRRSMREAVRDVLDRRYGPVRWPGVVVDVDPATVM
jgi:primosomal protein N' (replication factor Y)